jgi:hypothetical protein
MLQANSFQEGEYNYGFFCDTLFTSFISDQVLTAINHKSLTVYTSSVNRVAIPETH